MAHTYVPPNDGMHLQNAPTTAWNEKNSYNNKYTYVLLTVRFQNPIFKENEEIFMKRKLCTDII